MYISILSGIFPAVFLISVVLYGLIYFFFLRKRNQIGIGKIAAEFVLTGFLLMFLYVTQARNLGLNMGRQINLYPLKPLITVYQYGLIDRSMFDQLILNVLMFLPLGILLPVVFPKYFSGVYAVICASFVLSLATEFSQYVGLRSADIDDLIANTFGGLLGYSIFVIIVFVRQRLGKQQSDNRAGSITIILAFIPILILSGFILVILARESRYTYGHIYYDHLKPRSVEFASEIRNEDSSGIVYKIYYPRTREQVMNDLLLITGFDCTFKNQGTVKVCEEEYGNAIIVYDHHTWSVNYYSGNPVIREQMDSLPDQFSSIAFEYLEYFGIDVDNLKQIQDSSWTGNNEIRFIFSPQSTAENVVIWGEIAVTMDEKGNLISIMDYRTYHEAFQDVQLISSPEALKIASKTGLGEFAQDVTVESVESAYYFVQETGYLLPAWKFSGYWYSTETQTEYDWQSVIAAVKY